MTLGWIVAASVAGGTLSAGLAAFSLYLRASWIPMLVSYAIGALLGAAFLEIIPAAFEKGEPHRAAGAILIGTALDELERTGGRYALITMCAAGGMAPAMIIERV